MQSDRSLTETQKKAVELIAKGFNKGMIAGACEVTVATINNWCKLPAFKQALAEAINFKSESSNYKLHDLYRKALEEVEGLLQDRNPHIRLGAARLACESYVHIAKAAAEEKMLAEIEARMEQLSSNFVSGVNEIEAAEDAVFKELPQSEDPA